MIRLSASAIGLAGALCVIAFISPAFGGDSLTADHPVIWLCSALFVAGLAWFVLFLILRRKPKVHAFTLPALLLLGLALRVIFFGSTPIYENDYKRYLWDGAVVASGENPYLYSPSTIKAASEPGARSVPRLAHLAVMSNTADSFVEGINSPNLTTIYPPAAQAVFTLAHWIGPFQAWGLKLVFLLIEILGLAALLLALRARQLPLQWSALYWLNPVIIVTTYNGVHMDVLLAAPLLAALLCVGRRPFVAATCLGVAAAIKLWPLLLAPVLFRGWRHRPLIYLGVALITALITAISLAPMLLQLDSDAGLAAYSANWTNSSFLFPGLRDGLGLVFESPDRLARYLIAVILVVFSLWLGFRQPQDGRKLPAHLMLLAGAFVLLSPTGYPWYFIWFLVFLPFAADHWSARGFALLSVGATVYWARFKLGEAGHYDVYTRLLLPLEFGVPLLVLAWDGWKARAHG